MNYLVATQYGHVYVTALSPTRIQVVTGTRRPVHVNRVDIEIQYGTVLNLHSDGHWRFGEAGHWATAHYQINARRADYITRRDDSVSESALKKLREELERVVDAWARTGKNVEHSLYNRRVDARNWRIELTESEIERLEGKLAELQQELAGKRAELERVKDAPLESFDEEQ